MSLSQKRPRILFVGPMIGRKPNHVTMQGQILSEFFSNAGYRVVAVSDVLNRYLRLLDIVRSVIRMRNSVDFMVLEIYGGRSFVVEDIASLVARLVGMKVLMWLHGGSLPGFAKRFPLWTRRVLGRAELLITPSAYLARTTKEVGFRARVIPNVISLPNYPYRHRRSVGPRLFWMRNLHPIWNPGMAIRVLARLKDRSADATLVMAGPDRGSRTEMENLAESHGVSDSIRFVGFLNTDGKAREGEQADIFINTNLIDNMPVALIEACAMGLPIVSTNVGGIPDLLTDGETGLLVDSNDEHSMVNAILRLIDEPELASRLSQNGKKLAESCSWSVVRPQWEAVFAEVLGERLPIEETTVPSAMSATSR